MSKYIPRLLEDYNKRIKPSLSKDLGISNQMRVPKILKNFLKYWIWTG